MANTLNRLFAVKRKSCKGRTRKSCSSSKKTCKWASGSKRSFCRSKKSRRRRG
jgi:hypothetical protein